MSGIRRRVALLGLIVGLTAVACLRGGGGSTIDLSATPTPEAPSEADSSDGSLVFAVAAVNSPRSTFAAYTDLAGYLARAVGLEPKFIGNRTYAEINGLIRFQEVTLAMVCSAPYVYGNAEFGMELLAVPVVKGRDTYQSYLVVRRDSPISDWNDLRGRTFAFSDPLSNSGRLVPVYQLWERGETPESFFRRYVFTYSHDNSIDAVASGLVDAAAVDSLVYDYALANGEDNADETKVIWRSQPFAINPVVVGPQLDPVLKSRLRDLLLNMHTTAQGRDILRRLAFDRFAAASDAAYGPIRTMIQDMAENSR